MKKVLLDENLNFYRANLHCHSTVSDGRKTVEELKRDYMAHGYSIIAFTDHDVYVNHDDLSDSEFLALNGYELDVGTSSDDPRESGKTCHLCYIALEKENDISVCYNKNKYIFGNAKAYADKQNYADLGDEYERVYSYDGVNDMIRIGIEKGFFVTYNHPVWSLEAYPQYSGYKGMHAMEIINFASIVAGWDDDNGHCYDDMLNLGNKVFCVGADDNHNRVPDTEPNCGSYGGYTMIGAPSLEYREVTKALENGMFYASSGNYELSGPEIYSLVYEDGEVTIKTSPARSIYFMQNIRSCGAVNAHTGEHVTEAKFKVDDCKWFRLVVVDDNGFKAYTNAYFLDDLK